MSSLLKKLSGRSPYELLTRTRQFAQSRAENYGFGTSLPGQTPLLNSDDRLQSFLAPWNEDREGFKYLVKTRFADEVERIINKADKIIEGRFDLLGFEDLRFGKNIPNWHFDPLSEKHSPQVHWTKINEVSSEKTGDKKIIWELNRHQYFLTLGQAYLITGDEVYAETFDAHLTDWFENNPPKKGVNWLSSLELAFRSMSWIRAFYFFSESDSFRRSTRDLMLKFIALQARHIEKFLSTYFSPNTHLTGEALGLYLIGSFLAETTETKRWRQKGYRILIEALDFQIRPDGVYCEQSSHYCRYTADFYLFLFSLRRHLNLSVDAAAEEKIEKLCEFLMYTTEPNGETPLFGDEDGGKFLHYDERPLNDMRATLEKASLYFGRNDMRCVAGEASSQLLFTDGAKGLERYDATTPTIPDQKIKTFSDSGFYVARNKWAADADMILIDCGPHGFMNCGHAHADALSFTLDVNGAPLFIDSGTYLYTSDLSARDAFRSSSFHNCLSVDGFSSSKTDGAFSWKTIANARLIEWQANDDGVYFVGSHNGFEEIGVEYQRSIKYVSSKEIKIVEKIKTETSHRFDVNFILSPKVIAKLNQDKIEFSEVASNKMIAELSADTSKTDSGSSGGWTISDHNVSFIYGKLTPTKKLVFSVTSATDIDIILSLALTR